MIKYESPVLNAVAYPPTMLFVPVQMAGLNVGFNVAGMLIGAVAFEITPIVWIATTIVGHLALAWWAVREPHIVGVNRAAGKYFGKTPNIVPTEAARKYVP